MASNRVRHAVSRSTGATTWTRQEDGVWKTTCLNHGSETTSEARGQAWKNGSTPSNFCAKCKAIASGKAERITGPRLDLPTTPTQRKAAAKPTSKPKVARTSKPKTAPARKGAVK